MYGSNFLGRQRRLLLSRRKSKQRILQGGGEQSWSHSEEDIIRIDFALRRLDEAQYGLCTMCGTPISEARLAILPEATRCTGCQEKTELQIGHA